MDLTDHIIKQAGLRATAPRTKILEVLASSGKRHMSADEVHQVLKDEDSSIGLPTVYRVLTHFVEAGLVSRQCFEDGHWIFELDRGSHHDHLICVDCGRILEFSDPLIAERQGAIAREHGFAIRDRSLVIYGICAACRARLGSQSDAS